MTARKSERLLNLLITLLVSRTYVGKARIREVIEDALTITRNEWRYIAEAATEFG